MLTIVLIHTYVIDDTDVLNCCRLYTSACVFATLDCMTYILELYSVLMRPSKIPSLVLITFVMPCDVLNNCVVITELSVVRSLLFAITVDKEEI